MTDNKLLLKSRNIFTADREAVFSGAVSIADSVIENVFKSSAELPSEAQGYTVIDCGERLIMPGFCDSHIHGFFGSLQSSSVSLGGCRSEEEAAAKAAEFYRDEINRGFDDWLFGFGWMHFTWEKKNLPSKETLDRYFKNTPVCLFNDEMHSVWVNSEALKRCAITSATPDPSIGRIFRDNIGNPTGYLLEPEAMDLVVSKALRFTPERLRATAENLLSEAARCGVTSMSDIQILNSLDPALYSKLEKDGKLTCRMHMVFPMEQPLEDILEQRSEYASDYLRFSGVKEFLDGTAPMQTGVLVEPYNEPAGFNAPLLVDMERTIKKAILFDKNGIRIRFHACGSGAVRSALDIFEAVRNANGYNDTRHTIEHIEDIHPDDIPRFKKLSVTASVQPDHLLVEEYALHPFHEILGEERCRWAWPFKSLIESGAEVSFGTDYPISPLNPMIGVFRAVTRLHEDNKPEGGWIPEEKLTVEQALYHYTAASSKQMYTENLTGKLIPGLAADITVLDGNPFECNPLELRNIKTFMTFSGGKRVFG